MPASGQYIETEVKIRFAGTAGAAREMLERAAYRIIQERTLESDQIFDRGDGELRRGGRLLRVRRAGGETTVTYKGPARSERHKSREEIEFQASDAAALAGVLDRLGYSPRFRYEKYRTKFAASGEEGIVTIDETPIGVFLELEGPGYWIDETAGRLGFPAEQYLTASYSYLYEEYCRANPGAPLNMTFPGEQPI